MGLDLALVGLVLVTAIRGWLKGFMVQAIRLGAFVASVYVASPLRDEIKSRAIEYLPKIPPQIVDRLLWWASLAVSYVLMVAVASLAVAVARRQAYGNSDRGRGDQFAGFGFGVIKGVIVVAFLVSSIQTRGEAYLASLPMAKEQTSESIAWKLNAEYKPADRIWACPPVQLFVNQIQQMGVRGPALPESKDEVSARTEGRAPKLEWNGESGPKGAAGGASIDLGNLSAQLEILQKHLQGVSNDPK